MCVQGHFDVGICARNGPKGAFWGHLIGAAVPFFYYFLIGSIFCFGMVWAENQ
jgi:hypothetical protein